MATVLSFLCLLALLLLLASTFTSAVDPNVVQLDIVFPHNDTVYKPVYPFPVVFAFHNAAVAWPFKFNLQWNLDSLPDPIPITGDGFWRQAGGGGNASDAPRNPWLLTYSIPHKSLTLP